MPTTLALTLHAMAYPLAAANQLLTVSAAALVLLQLVQYWSIYWVIDV